MKKFVTGTVLAIALAVGFVAAGSPAYAAGPTDSAKTQVCTGVSGQAGGACGTGGVDISKTLKGVLNLLTVIAGIIAVIMVVISGMKYTTSGGDPQAVSSAKRTLIYALVGVVVVAMSQFMVHFILAKTK
jgi:hypothetical protein